MNKSILFISILPIHSKGNQSLYNTIKGYIKDQYKVNIITPYLCKTDINLRNLESIRIKKYKFHDDLLINYNIDYKNYNASLFRKKLNFIHSNKYELLKNILACFLFYFFVLKQIAINHRLINVKIIYSYGVHSVFIGKTLSVFMNKFFVTRFQGTTIYQYLKNGKLPVFLMHHKIALKIPANLVVMANDGTKGDKVLNKIKNKSNILFLHNGVDNRRKKTQVKKENKFIFLTCNRLQYWKRLDRIIYIAYKLKDYGINFKFIIIGNGELKNDLENMINYYGLQDVVNIINGVNFEQLNEYYSKANYYITLNDNSNLTNGLLESLYLNVPVITFEEPSIKKFYKCNFYFNFRNDLDVQIKNFVNIIVNKSFNYNIVEKIYTWEERMKREIETIEEELYAKNYQ